MRTISMWLAIFVWLALVWWIGAFFGKAFAKWENVAQEWQPYLDKLSPEQQSRTKQWFQGIRSPHGVPCCNMADGHRTLEDWRGSTFWIPNPAALGAIEWIQVPPDAVVYNAGNPTGEAVVWYVIQGPRQVYIRCFVPGGGV